MKDLGVSNRHSMASPAMEDSKSYPSASFDHKALPHMKKHKVGDTGKMTVKYKVTSQQAYRDGTGHTGVDITHAQPAVKSKNEKDLENEADAVEAKEKIKGDVK